jgi:Dyp-type peroxidase family
MNDKVRTRSTGLAGVTNLSVLAPLRNEMVPGIEPMSYVGRLRKVLLALHASRKNVRESELLRVFPDVVGRFGIIHGFRYALVEPQAGPEGMPSTFGTWRLSLNVTFDGGWEPYMRVIQRDIGPLLDLLFCHSPDYPGSKVSFDRYCDWVRRHEVPAGLFYADSASTVNDADYLARVEAMQRAGESEETLARCHLPSEPNRQKDALDKAGKSPVRALAVPLRTLKGLYRLATFFPPNADGDVLLRFAQDALRSPIEFMQIVQKGTSGSPPPEELRQLSPAELQELARVWAQTKVLLRDELHWLQWDKLAAPAPKPRAKVDDPAALQAHVLGEGERMTHACLVLLRVQNAERALEKIAELAESCGPVAAGDIGYMVGFTYPGLQELGVTQDLLSALPQEFFEGMEARFGLLGDLRSNHPDRWTRPLLREHQGQQHVDLDAVHLVVQVRLRDEMNHEEMHPHLLEKVIDLDQPQTGLRVMAAEPMRSYRAKDDKLAVGHMGIADGLSQPKLPSSPSSPFKHHDDEVSAGELLLGYASDRGDAAPDPKEDPWLQPGGLLHNGSFLAIRKLRQFMDRLDAKAPLPAPAGKSLPEAMVGRKADGEPLHGWPADKEHDNDFKFDSPEASDACPMHSHIRRCNPRDGRAYTPRILRRGMSWGKHSESDRSTPRGVMFMAYCASLSEQFETMQRWVAGGNASGVGSAQGDPLLRVPEEGKNYTFRYMVDGAVKRVLFDDKPLVQLQWGLYAFVPSLHALKNFAEFTRGAEAVSPAPTPGPKESPALIALREDREAMRALLEDRDRSELVWRWVREGSPLANGGGYGKLLGKRDDVLAVLKDPGDKYSVSGYGERMEDTIGLNLLGMDPSHPRYDKEFPVKGAIASIGEQEAFEKALELAQKVLMQFKTVARLPSADGDNVERYSVDLVDFSNAVLVQLCIEWFGLPDGKHMVDGGYRAGDRPAKPLCPGSLGPASRYMFMPHPQTKLEEDGRFHAKAVREAVGNWLGDSPDLKGHRLAAAIQAALKLKGSEQYLADNIAGTMLGFTPSVQSNFLRVMETWLDDGRSLWELQQALFEHSRSPTLGYEEAKDALRGPLMAAICKNPVPTMAWRSPVVNGKPDTDPRKRVVLGLQSALADGGAPELVFGRHHDEQGKDTTLHGCPGYELAMGVMLALIGSLMKAGTLRPTGSPVLLILTLPAQP